MTPGTGQPFSDVRQLLLVPGMAPEWVAAIEPLATVFGGDTVNPLTAPPGVIAAFSSATTSGICMGSP